MRINIILVAALSAAVIFVADSPKKVKAQAEDNQTTQSQVIVAVQIGDSLSKIAEMHQTTYVRLFDANPGIKDPNIIYPGDKVRIPSPGEQLASRSVPADNPAETAVAPKPKQQPASQQRRLAAQPSSGVAVASGSVWDRLAQCESGGNWSINTGNGYYGGLQFALSSWQAAGGSGMPHHASREEQIARGKILQSIQGWGAWPACTSKLGIR